MLTLLRRTVLENPYIPHKPTPKQALFLTVPQTERLFGGAAGGGKSDAALMGALQFVTEPDYAALVLRQSYKDLSLPSALMDRAMGWLAPTDASWNESKKTWTFPSGSTLTFGYLERPADVYQYQGSEFQLLAFDELTQFNLFEYTYMRSRLRRLRGSRVPLRVLSGSNPGGRGHEWVKERFLLTAHPERVFIPSLLDDNPYLDREEYVRSLAELDPVTRRQLLSGDWDVIAKGELFSRVWFKAVEEDRVPRLARIVRYWDLASTKPHHGNRDPDWTVGTLAGIAANGRDVYLLDVARFRDTPEGTMARIAWQAEQDGLGVEVYIELEPGSSGKFTASGFAERLRGYTYRARAPKGSKFERAGPVSSAAERGEVFYRKGHFDTEWFVELEQFPQTGVHDDRVDSVSGVYTILVPPKRRSESRGRSYSQQSIA